MPRRVNAGSVAVELLGVQLIINLFPWPCLAPRARLHHKGADHVALLPRHEGRSVGIAWVFSQLFLRGIEI